MIPTSTLQDPLIKISKFQKIKQCLPKLILGITVSVGSLLSVQAQTSQTFNATGAVQTYTVPAGVTSITIDMAGGQGGNGSSKGGRVQCNLTVTPGATLNLYVGKGSRPTWNGGATDPAGNGNTGGDATDIRIGGTALTNRVIVAGGGGGRSNNSGNLGGDGGGLIGGTPALLGTDLTTSTGGTQNAGGTGGTATGNTGGAGSLGLGGVNAGNFSGGVGGGGYYGGGQGGRAAGGGGGSSYTDAVLATNVVHTQGFQSGNGYISIIFPPNITSFTPTSAKPGDQVIIAGNNFNTTASNNIVFFGATKATVSAATTTQLTVTVPLGATYGPITELNTGTNLACYSLKNFNPIYSPAKTGITTSDFSPKVDFTTPSQARAVAIGDIDGDGKPDLVATNYFSGSVSVYRNNSISGTIGTGSFAAKVDFTTGTNPFSIAIGDIDGDGKLDLAVTNWLSTSVSVLRNTSSSGTISFATKQDFTTGLTPEGVAIGDIDGDGKPDLATANNNSNSVSVFRSTSTSGTISFIAKQDFITANSPISVVIGDIDGDSKADLSVSNNGSNSVSVFRNTSSTGSIGFATKLDFTTGANPYFVSIGDLDGDDKLDLAVANSGTTSVSVLLNSSTSGSVSFALKQDFTTGSQPQSVAIGDINGDGKPDLVVGNSLSTSVSIYRNISTSGTVGFIAKQDFTTGSIPVSVALGDLDGDGRTDLAVANYSGASVSVLRNADPPAPTITSFTPASAKPGDLVTITGTGFNSTSTTNNVVFFGATRAFVATATSTELTVTVPAGATYAPITELNKGSGLLASSMVNFTPSYSPNKVGITSFDYTAPTIFNSINNNSSVNSVAIGDLDGDGKPDLAFTNLTSTSTQISILRNISSNGSLTAGSFAPVVNVTVDAQPTSIAFGDLDGDGKLDIAVLNSFGANVSILRNISTSGSITAGSFAAIVNFPVNIRSEMLVLGDVDGDGKIDIAVSGSTQLSNNTISILKNNSTSGSISFATKVDFTTGQSTGPIFIALGDLDGDRKPDLVSANTTSNNISIFRNTSTIGIINTGSFAANQDFAAGTNPKSVAIGDIDGDGKNDIAVVSFLGTTPLSIFRNTASSGTIDATSFAAKQDFSVGSFCYHVAFGDIDGDSKLDLIVNRNSTVSFFRNISTPGNLAPSNFESIVNINNQTNNYFAAIGDLDGDGRPDLVQANYQGNTLGIMRNTERPTITTTGTLAALTTTYGTASSTTSFNISGSNLTNDIEVTAPAGFEVSISSSNGFGNSLTLTRTGVTVTSTTIFIRLKANNTVALSPYTGNVVCTSSNASNVNVPTTSSTVTGAPLSVTASNAIKTYGQVLTGAAGSTAFTSTGLLNGETIGSVSIAYTSGTGNGNTVTDAVGTYTGKVTPSAATGGTFTASNYTITYATGNLVVGTVPLTITATNANKTYGQVLTGAAGSTAFTSAGLLNGETIGTVTLAYGTGAAATAAVATYTGTVTPIAATGGTFTATNYAITYANGNIIVGQAPLTVTASNANKTYGQTLTTTAGSTAFTSSGLLNGETIGTVTQSYATGAAATAAVGTYNASVTPSAATGGTFLAGNYNITYATGNIIVGQQNLTVTASSAPKSYGSTLTGGTGSTAFTSTGLQNGETIGSVTIAYTTGTGNGNAATDAIGTYTNKVTPSTATGGTFILSNYNITYASGDIVISTAPLTITASNANKTYGATLTGAAGSTLFTSSGLQNNETIGTVTLAYGTGAAATAPVATYSGTITPSAAIGGTFTASNYAITYANGNIIIAQAPLTITATNANKTYGQVLTGTSGSTAFTSTGLLNGETIGTITIAYGTGAEASAAANTYTGSVIPSAATGGTFTAGNYNITYAVGNIIVGRANLTITGVTANNKLLDGTTTATLSGTPILNGVIGSDNVTVTGTPVANFATSAVGNNIPVTVTGYTLGGTAAGNYTPIQPTGLTANIFSAVINLSGSLNAYIGCIGSPSTAQSFTVSGTDLLGNITLTAPTGYELSTTANGTYTNSIVLTATGGTTVANTTVFVRLNSLVLGTVAGNIVATSNGATNKTIAATGTVTAFTTVTPITGATQVCFASTIPFTNVTPGGVWSSGNITAATIDANGVITGRQAGTATISYTVTTAAGCVSSATRDILVNALPLITATASPSLVNKGQNTQLNVSAVGNIASFVWSPAGGTLTTNPATTTVRVNQNTTFTVTATSTAGCVNTANVAVTTKDEVYVETVNVFTPNGDGINDRFVIKNLDLYPNNKLQVFDRTGKIIYEKENYANNWDGTVNGQLLTKDTYFYVLTVNGLIVKKATITLVR